MAMAIMMNCTLMVPCSFFCGDLAGNLVYDSGDELGATDRFLVS